ncbi:MAG: tetratricopeptide repeat protein [Rhodanobacteraceae bacterium]
MPDRSRQAEETLRRVRAMLRAGDHVRARGLLGPLTRQQPDDLEARRLLASSFHQTGEYARAQQELEACLHLRGGDVPTRVLLGRVLMAAGQLAQAERVLLGVDRDAPGNPEVTCTLARARLAQGRASQALDVLQKLAAPPQALAVEYWMLCGHALMALVRTADAANAFREWLKLEPDNAEARLRLAAALADDQRGAEAEAEVRRCMQSGVKSPNALFILGRALMDQRRFGEAEACFRDVVHLRPDYLTAQDNLSELVWMRTSDVDAAAVELDSALRTHPQVAAALRVAKARLWLAAGQPEGAVAILDGGLAHAASDPGLLRAAAGMALQFDGARALDYARRALQVVPDDWDALAVFGNALLATGNAAQALATADRLCARDPTNGEALAMRADALRMAGDARCCELLDYGRLIRAEPIDVPDGWSTLNAYLDDLVSALDALHGARAHPVSNSLRGGSQVALVPERSDHAALRAFPAAIDGAIRRYMQALGAGTDPMRRRNTGRYRLNGMWSVRLRANGFHLSHYHPKGWISSSCYLRLPSAVAGPGGEGWLTFGEPAFPTTPVLGAEYFLKPEPGLLALFPAYLWHGTVPFTGTARDARLTIAFDVVPANAGGG